KISAAAAFRRSLTGFIFRFLRGPLNHLPARHFCQLRNIGKIPAGEREDLRFLAEEAARKAINYVRAHPKR
ncbi:hypothetical protein, partial [Igneacidithiobacillus copahuensis]|uniref:hypothetical protein n=1 Tax=Igneacidithiobacillus copahuensis TaxID=2724909 RepID=UPI001C06FE3E